MHACLNSLSVGTPAIPLAYSRKFAPLLADVGWEYVVSLAEADPAGRVLEIAERGTELAAAAGATRSRADALLLKAAEALESQL
jgi:polysaccharide pyruvyl transferase WcaK-like protein